MVEDYEGIIMGLEYLLQQEGYSCLVARRRREAERILERESPDLLLLDIGLPDGDGFQLCGEIRGQYNYPIIFLTAREEEDDVVRAFDLGAVLYKMIMCQSLADAPFTGSGGYIFHLMKETGR